MKARPLRFGTVTNLAALGAGLLLAATPHCAGKSVSSDGDSGRGGSAGVAGTPVVYDGPTYTGPTTYGGSGGYGGSVGKGGCGSVLGTGGCGTGAVCSAVSSYCYTPAELAPCLAVDAGSDGSTGVGSGGESGGGSDGGDGGLAGQASNPMPIAIPRPPPDAGSDGSSGALPEPPTFLCPSGPIFPECIRGRNLPLPEPNYISLGWNGTACCYQWSLCF